MIYYVSHEINRGVVQSVEHQSPKLGVQGSSPCAPAILKTLENTDKSSVFKGFDIF